LSATHELKLQEIRADLRAKVEEGDFLGALEEFSKAVDIEAAMAKEAQEKDLKYLSQTLPEDQWETVSKALTFGWYFTVHRGDGIVELQMGRKRMTVKEDGSYQRN
jgi:hypothetical protein